MPAFCKQCGQELHNERHGVNLSPAEVRIFDIIKSTPGIERGEISSRLSCSKKTVSVHVYNINAKIEKNGIRISNTLGYAIKEFGRK